MVVVRAGDAGADADRAGGDEVVGQRRRSRVLHADLRALDAVVVDRAAEGRGPRPGLEGVLGEGAAEWQFHVGVDVDATGNHPATSGVDGLVGRRAVRREVGTHGRDRLAVDQEIGRLRAVRRDDRAVCDERAHRCLLGDGRAYVVRRRW